MAPLIANEKRGLRPKAVLAVFGGLFLIALLSVPVTTRSSALRQDPGSQIIFRTTYPKNSRMFLPAYLAERARPGERAQIHLRAAQWVGTMAVIAVLGIFDYLVLCRLLRRPRTGVNARRPDPAEGDSQPPASGFTLLP